MPDWLAPLIDWLSQHPEWAGVIVALIAFAESLAFVGVVVPGVVMLFAVMALVGASDAPLWPVLLWAWLGAVAGDQLSFWLGWRYRAALWRVWPLSKQSELRPKAKHFFQRWGTLSIVLGRFIGPIRPVIPVAAGMAKMSPWTFTWINLLSAVAWAPVYILPGALFGASLDIAGAVAGRFVLLMLLFTLLLWAWIWLLKRPTSRYVAGACGLLFGLMLGYWLWASIVPKERVQPDVTATGSDIALAKSLALRGWHIQRPAAKQYLLWLHTEADVESLPPRPMFYKARLADVVAVDVDSLPLRQVRHYWFENGRWEFLELQERHRASFLGQGFTVHNQ